MTFLANHFLSRIASFMGNKLGLSSEDEAVLLYGLEIVFSSSISFLLAIVLGIIFKVLAEVLMVIIAWFCLRQFAGGAHCSSMWRCALTSSLVPALLGLLAGWLSRYLQKNFILYLFALIFIAAIFITLRLAPADNPQKPVRSSRRRRRFRNLALAAELLWLFYCWGRRCWPQENILHWCWPVRWPLSGDIFNSCRLPGDVPHRYFLGHT